jgi:predicted RNA-binding protein with PUA-like domain
MQYWLVKTEPDSFGWDQQVTNKVEPWSGVRSHQAKNNLRAMKQGDRAFFYHSNVGKEIVGVVEVVREAYPDPADEKWACVDMQTVGPVPKPVTLAAMKADPALADMALVRYSRLSVAPVTAKEWAYVCKLGGFKG